MGKTQTVDQTPTVDSRQPFMQHKCLFFCFYVNAAQATDAVDSWHARSSVNLRMCQLINHSVQGFNDSWLPELFSIRLFFQ